MRASLDVDCAAGRPRLVRAAAKSSASAAASRASFDSRGFEPAVPPDPHPLSPHTLAASIPVRSPAQSCSGRPADEELRKPAHEPREPRADPACFPRRPSVLSRPQARPPASRTAMIQQPPKPMTGVAPANYKMQTEAVQMSSTSGKRSYLLFLSSFAPGTSRMWCPVRPPLSCRLDRFADTALRWRALDPTHRTVSTSCHSSRRPSRARASPVRPVRLGSSARGSSPARAPWTRPD